MRSKRRSPITLLELIVVISILSLTFGLFSINIVKALQEQRFYSNVAFLTDELKLSQELMLLLNMDIQFHLMSRGDGRITTSYTTTGNTPDMWDKIAKIKKTLSHIDRITFNEFELAPSKEGKITLEFLSNGSVMSKGLLKLSYKQLERAIPLPGYPAPISSQTLGEVALNAPKIEEAFLFEKALLEETSIVIGAIKNKEEKEVTKNSPSPSSLDVFPKRPK